MSYLSLRSNEVSWSDNCTACANYVVLEDPAMCNRLTVVDGRCFRGDWGKDNHYFEYLIQLPQAWVLPIAFVLRFTFWALGTWDWKGDTTHGQEEAVVKTCDESGANCIEHLRKRRIEDRSCVEWNEWSHPNDDSTFDPVTLWNSGVYPCFWNMSVPVSDWNSDKLRVFFGVWDELSDEWGLTDWEFDEAFVVSDFSIEFLLPTTSTTLPTTTTSKPTTTKAPTSTTEAPTTTTKTPTTTTMIPTTTTTMIPTTTTTAKPSTSTLKPTTTEPIKTSTPTPTDPSSSTLPATTRRPTNTSKGATTSLFTTTTATKGRNKENNRLYGVLLNAAVSAVFVCVLLLCVLAVWWLRRKKKTAPPKEVQSGEVRVFVVDNAIEMQSRAVYDSQPTAERSEAFMPGSRSVSDLMRSGAVALSGMRAFRKQRPSLLFSASGVVLPLPEPGAVLPLKLKPFAYGIEEADEGFRGEGEGKVKDEGVESATLRRENGDDFRKILMQLKLDAKTAEEKNTGRILDLAFTMEPKAITEEFQTLSKLGIGAERIIELMKSKADNILLAKGITNGAKLETVTDDSDEKREDSEELYESGPKSKTTRGFETHGASEDLLILVAKQQLAARSSAEEKVAVRKVSRALAMAPAKMEEAFRAQLQMGANTEGIVLKLADSADCIMSATDSAVAAQVTPGAPPPRKRLSAK